MNLISASMMNCLIFVKNDCTNCSDSGEPKDIISDVKIKNNRSRCEISKFTLQIYAFVYQRLMGFPQGRLDYETLKTINFFESIHRLNHCQNTLELFTCDRSMVMRMISVI